MSWISVNWIFEADRISWRRFSLYRRLSIDAMTGVFAVVLPNQMLTRCIQCVKTHWRLCNALQWNLKSRNRRSSALDCCSNKCVAQTNKDNLGRSVAFCPLWCPVPSLVKISQPSWILASSLLVNIASLSASTIAQNVFEFVSSIEISESLKNADMMS